MKVEDGENQDLGVIENTTEETKILIAENSGFDIPFNKPALMGKEPYYVTTAVYSGHTSGNGDFTKKCHQFFKERYGFEKSLLTSSCTDALEMASILCDIKEGDEVIIPSYTFVSTANAFALRGARILFADSEKDHPNVSVDSILSLITEKTKAIVIVHYSGMACDIEKLQKEIKDQDIMLIEDAAHSIDSQYKGKPLGSFGDLSTFSFHETKNVICGEGGLLVINNKKLQERAEIIWEKGTNRAAFFRGEVDKYTWVDLGSSYLPSDITAAFLYAQLEQIDRIQNKRIQIWNHYYNSLKNLENDKHLELPLVKDYMDVNGHLFYIKCKSLDERTALIQFLRAKGVSSVFHYLPLHLSPFYKGKHPGHKMENSINFGEELLRLPLFYDLTEDEQNHIINSLIEFYS